MVRDKLVFSCRDDLSKLKLYGVGSGLTLRKTIEILSVCESTKKEPADAKAATVDALTARPKAEQNRENRNSPTRTHPKYCRPSVGQQPQAQTSAVTATENILLARKTGPKTNCRKCINVGHFAVVC